MKMRALLASVLLVGLVGFSAATATADPNLNNVPAHRHWIQLNSGETVQVGPSVCDNPNLQEAFNQFHNNLHASAGSRSGGAGLHNGTGGDHVRCWLPIAELTLIAWMRGVRAGTLTSVNDVLSPVRALAFGSPRMAGLRAMDELTCPSCGAPASPDLRFCGNCGTSLERTCPSCGQTWAPSFRFCGNCGTPLSSDSAPTPSAGVTPEERKVVTVIFADIGGSTEMATRLDPEDLRGVLRPFFDAMVEEIERFGGTVEKFIGDAVMAVFGVPVAHEDDEERAVRAAFAMQARMVTLNREVTERAGGDLDLRVGVNTGEVLAAHSSHREGYVTGEVVNVAARLQTVAGSGRGGGPADARRHRATIAYRDMGPFELKGIDEPVAVYEALPDRRPEEARRPDAPMVGRDDELDLLRLVLGRARKQAKPGLVTLVGPPGIGKSRLSGEFLGVWTRPGPTRSRSSAAGASPTTAARTGRWPRSSRPTRGSSTATRRT